VSRLVARWLPDGRRLHVSDGPIDLIIEAWGAAHQVHEAYAAAIECARSILDELCAELPALRAPQPSPPMQGAVACLMQQAVAPYAHASFITPMAAVAGAVAQHVLLAMVSAATLERAYVNNDGDIALHLAPAQAFDVVIMGLAGNRLGSVKIRSSDPVRGIATSGWQGRSHSLGIADSVTTLAASASKADVAATMIANAVNLPGHQAMDRSSANTLSPDSDLGNRLVTRAVAKLTNVDRRKALSAGTGVASRLVRSGLIAATVLHLQGETAVELNSLPGSETWLRGQDLNL